LVEFNDYVTLIECPLNDDRALAVLDAVKKVVPNKPLRYVVATHHHFDHTGGLRACASTGATILVQGAAKPYFEKVWAQPYSIRPDAYAKANRQPVVEAVGDKRVLTDSMNALELYHIQNDHADTMLLGYLPKQKVLIEVDLWNPPPAGTPNPAPGRDIQVLWDTIQRMKLDVQQITPMHGRLVTLADLRTAAGRGTN
jgi:glyoxylase-like metal-dependent hydrolase (beta-lactamase superfamily II)